MDKIGEIDMLEGARERKEQVKAINEEPAIQKLVQINVNTVAQQSKALVELKKEQEIIALCKIINPSLNKGQTLPQSIGVAQPVS